MKKVPFSVYMFEDEIELLKKEAKDQRKKASEVGRESILKRLEKSIE